MDFSIDGLRAAGFTGFESIAALRANDLASVPAQPGVYVVMRNPDSSPTFLPESPGGWFKNRDPTLPAQSLRTAWIPNVCVLYIGKAGGDGKNATLRSRLRAYLRHGGGARAGHWGGRAIWQLSDSSDLIVAWLSSEFSPREFERALIAEFVSTYGRRPFANRTS